MTYLELSRYIKIQNQQTQSYKLQNCHLVIDGRSFFHQTYQKSGGSVIVGTECDKYFYYLHDKFSQFESKDITCYVIYNAQTCSDLNKKVSLHQYVINARRDILLEANKSIDPLFTREVQMEVLNKMHIRFFVCDKYDITEDIISVARKFKCPVLTSSLELCLYGVSCITPKSLTFGDEITCTLYSHEAVKAQFGLYDKTPLLLTLLNESGQHYRRLANIVECQNKNKVVVSTVRWVKRQRDALDKIPLEGGDKQSFIAMYNKITLTYVYSRRTLARRFFERNTDRYVKYHYEILKNDKSWFSKGVSDGQIAMPFIDLKKHGLYSGSQLAYDENRPDAMLAAKDIIAYAHNVLINSKTSKITFVGRQNNATCAAEIVTERDYEISNKAMFTQKYSRKGRPENMNPFKTFMLHSLPEYHFISENENLIGNIHSQLDEVLFISLVYYVRKINSNFIFGAHCVLLCFVMLGFVMRVVNEDFDLQPLSLESYCLVKAINLKGLNYEDCSAFAKGMSHFLKSKVAEESLDRSFLHSLAEFQHCLQQMNYLVRLCNADISCTRYYRAFNGNFINNLKITFKDEKDLEKFLRNSFGFSTVVELYLKIVDVFKNRLENNLAKNVNRFQKCYSQESIK